MDTRRQYNEAFETLRGAVRSLNVESLDHILCQFPILCQDASTYFAEVVISTSPKDATKIFVSRMVNVLSSILTSRCSNQSRNLKYATQICTSIAEASPNWLLILVRHIFQTEFENDGHIHFVHGCVELLYRKPYSESEESKTFLRYIHEQVRFAAAQARTDSWNIVLNTLSNESKSSKSCMRETKILSSLKPRKYVLYLEQFTDTNEDVSNQFTTVREVTHIEGNDTMDNYIASLCILFTVCPKQMILEIRKRRLEGWISTNLVSFLAKEKQKIRNTNSEFWESVILSAYRIFPVLLRAHGRFVIEQNDIPWSTQNDDEDTSEKLDMLDLKILATLRKHIDSFPATETKSHSSFLNIHKFTVQVMELWLCKEQRKKIILADHLEWMSLAGVKSCLQHEIMHGGVVLKDCTSIWKTPGTLGGHCMDELIVSTLGKNDIICGLLRNEIAHTYGEDVHSSFGKQKHLKISWESLHSFVDSFLGAIGKDSRHHPSFWEASSIISQYLHWYCLWQLVEHDKNHISISVKEIEVIFDKIQQIVNIITKSFYRAERNENLTLCAEGHLQMPFSKASSHCVCKKTGHEQASAIILSMQPPEWHVWMTWYAGLCVRSSETQDRDGENRICSFKSSSKQQTRNCISSSVILTNDQQLTEDVVFEILRTSLFLSSRGREYVNFEWVLCNMKGNIKLEAGLHPRMTDHIFSLVDKVVSNFLAKFTSNHNGKPTTVTIRKALCNGIEIISTMSNPISTEELNRQTLRAEIFGIVALVKKLRLMSFHIETVQESMPNFVNSLVSITNVAKGHFLIDDPVLISLDTICSWIGTKNGIFKPSLRTTFDEIEL